MPVLSAPKSNSLSRGLSINSRKRFHLLNEETKRNIQQRKSHFERLPIELKVEIYVFCQALYPRFSAKEAPLLLCQVSATWRTIVLSTPRLWAGFEVKVPDFGAVDSVQHQNQLRSMNLWLERSRNNPLSVRIIQNPVGRIPDYRSAELLAALIPHARRWRDIHFHIPSSSVQPLQESLPEQFPELRSLTLDMRGLWSSIIPLDIRTLGIPWEQLTDLNLHLDYNHLLTLDECLGILAQCTNLYRCTLNADCAFLANSRRPEKVALPMLQALNLNLQRGEQVWNNGFRITDPPESCLVSFLEQFEFSRLQSLRMEWLVMWNGDSTHWSEAHPRFTSILKNSSPALQSLSLVYLPLAESDILACLAEVPNLTNLDLRFSLADREHDPISDSLLRALTLGPDRSSAGLLPLLDHIYLQCYGARSTTSQVIDLVESRWVPSPRDGANEARRGLKSFRFISMKPADLELRERLESWLEGGLDASVDRVRVR
ncbi:hypothetical protein Hypma_012396 [Hypsizygus marmoreus]|uniref:F-box domain-containing protein n=1 Tax=Hypsizygus marmoreus TaxID=39966 RepID=A0A369JLE4_HYPMA|nr:hypothetical protein Hypma_012396 [Hypsizygus marmoreus]